MLFLTALVLGPLSLPLFVIVIPQTEPQPTVCVPCLLLSKSAWHGRLLPFALTYYAILALFSIAVIRCPDKGI